MQEYQEAQLDKFLREERNDAIGWARELLQRSDWLILDTETTGLDSQAEVCQLAVLSPQGIVRLDTLVKPTRPIPDGASRIHGITDAMVETAPSFRDVGPNLSFLLEGNDLVVYNLAFDTRILAQSAQAVGLTWPLFGPVPYEKRHCAMVQYARWFGDWHDYHQSFTYQRLPTLAKGLAHSALTDCRSTLALIRQMAEAKLDEP